MVNTRALIFHMFVPYDKTFSMGTKLFDLLTLILNLDLLFKNFNISHNFWMARVRAFIFHMGIPYDKSFYLVSKCLTLTLNFDLHFKNFNIGRNFWMVRDKPFIFHMRIPYDKPLPLAYGIWGHSCFTNTSYFPITIIAITLVNYQYSEIWPL